MNPGLDLSPEPGRNRVLGAAYMAAVITEDLDMLAMYRTAYSAEQLLAALEQQTVIMARRIVVDSDMTLHEYGDASIGAATVMQGMQGEPL